MFFGFFLKEGTTQTSYFFNLGALWAGLAPGIDEIYDIALYSAVFFLFEWQKLLQT